MQRRKFIAATGGLAAIATPFSVGAATASDDKKKVSGEPIKVEIDEYENNSDIREILDSDAFIVNESNNHVNAWYNKEYYYDSFGDELGEDFTAEDIHSIAEKEKEKAKEKKDDESRYEEFVNSKESSDFEITSIPYDNVLEIGEDAYLSFSNHDPELEEIENDIPWSVVSAYGYDMSEITYYSISFEALPTGGSGTVDMECFYHVPITAEGSSSERVTVSSSRNETRYEGYLFSAGSSVDVESELRIVNEDTGETHSAELYSQSGSAFNRTIEETKSAATSFTVEPDTTYHVGVSMRTTISVYGGGASVDFGDVQYDRDNRVSPGSFNLTF